MNESLPQWAYRQVGYSHQPFTLELEGSNPSTLTIIPRNAVAMKQCLVMGVAVEPLPELAGPSNEGVAFIHDYTLNG